MDLPRKASTEEDSAAYEIKELFIEACVREWRPEYFSEFVSPNNLQAMSMLDSSALDDLKEAGTPLHSAPDLSASLHHEMSSVRRENWLKQHLRVNLQDQDFQNKVGARFDEDLRDAGLPHLAGVGRKMVDKVSFWLSSPLWTALTLHSPGQSACKVSTQKKSLIGTTT
jgi:hypothetical protein